MICYTLDPDAHVNSLGPKSCSRPTVSLSIGVSFVSLVTLMFQAMRYSSVPPTGPVKQLQLF